MAARSLHWGTQVKAMLLLAMLAGHEASRVQEQVRLMGALAGQGRGTVAEQGPEDDWQAENGMCKWETTSGGCVGPEFQGASSCKYRRLPLDWPPPSSQSCRLTDEYMLEKDRSRYFKLQSELLAAKAKKFEQCKGLKIYQLSGAIHCKRRAKHMLRALEFMSKAQDADLVNSLSEEEKASERALFDSALGSLSESIGPDGVLVMELQAKMKKSSAMREDPSRSAAKIVGLLQKLLKGTEAEQQEARDEIKNMRDEDTVEEESADDESDVVQKLEVNPRELNKVIDEVNVFENDDDSEDDTPDKQSMLQQAANTSKFEGAVTTASKTVGTIAFILIATLVVCAVVWVVVEVIAAIVAWALLAVLGCSIYTVGYNKAVDDANKVVQKKGALSTMKCFAQVFAYPFVLIGRAVVNIANLFKKPKKDKRHSLLQLEGAVNASIEN